MPLLPPVLAKATTAIGVLGVGGLLAAEGAPALLTEGGVALASSMVGAVVAWATLRSQRPKVEAEADKSTTEAGSVVVQSATDVVELMRQVQSDLQKAAAEREASLRAEIMRLGEEVAHLSALVEEALDQGVKFSRPVQRRPPRKRLD